MGTNQLKNDWGLLNGESLGWLMCVPNPKSLEACEDHGNPNMTPIKGGRHQQKYLGKATTGPWTMIIHTPLLWRPYGCKKVAAMGRISRGFPRNLRHGIILRFVEESSRRLRRLLMARCLRNTSQNWSRTCSFQDFFENTCLSIFQLRVWRGELKFEICIYQRCCK